MNIIKYSYHKYEVISTAPLASWNEKQKIVYVYTIFTDYEAIESDEWYYSEQEAITAACNHIDILEDGPDEPDYDAPTSHETYMKAHEDRQKLRGC